MIQISFVLICYQNSLGVAAVHFKEHRVLQQLISSFYHCIMSGIAIE